MHALVICDDPDIMMIYRRLFRDMVGADWTATAIASSRIYTDEIAAQITDGPADVIIAHDHVILYHLARTGPHPKPIIGCDSWYTPYSERLMLDSGMWPLRVPWAIDEFVELTELAASTHVLQRHVRLAFPLRPLPQEERNWRTLRPYLDERIGDERLSFQRFESEQRERLTLAAVSEPDLIAACETYRHKTLGTLLELSVLADEAQHRPWIQSVIPTVNLYKLWLSFDKHTDAFAWIDSVGEGVLRLTHVEWEKSFIIKSQEVVCEGGAVEILDCIEQIIDQQETGAAVQRASVDER